MGRATFDNFQDKFLTIEFPNVVEEEYTCQYCDDEFTLEQIKKTIGGKVNTTRVNNINKILPYLNKYRKDFGLDTCLKKAHFIAQVTHESAKFRTFEEDERWNYKYKNRKNGKITSLPGVFSNQKRVFDETMGESLKDHLSEIFKFTNCNDELITKTNDEIKKILIDEKVEVIDKKIYTNYQQGDELLKSILKTVINAEGVEEEEVDYNIYLQNHAHFGLQLLSRMYAPYPGDSRGLGNGDELSRDGWKYKGRGLKQLTGIGNYNSFTNYRNRTDITFPDDTSGSIDFAINEDENNPQDVMKGNYIKIKEPIYAVQSALYFWNEGTKYNSKYAVEHAENDDVKGVSKAVNLYDNDNLSKREAFYNKARKKDSFDIVRHYKDLYDNGNDDQKEKAKAYFEKWKDDDENAKEILDEINGTNESSSEEENTVPNSTQKGS